MTVETRLTLAELFAGCTNIEYVHEHDGLRGVTIVARDTLDHHDDWRTRLGETIILAVPMIGGPDISLLFLARQVSFPLQGDHLDVELCSISAPLDGRHPQ